MSRVTVINVAFQEDAPSTQKGRLVAEDATGAATGKDSEGYWVKQADLSGITYLVKDLTLGTTTASGSVTISTSIRDTPVQDKIVWTGDGNGEVVGWNFTHEVAGTAFPTGGSRYCVEYEFTPTAGSAYAHKVQFVGVATPVIGT